MPEHPAPETHRETTVLIISVFIAGLCSLIYELLIGTVSSYFLGDSIKQFSITIGLYMAAMGAGSLASRLITANLLVRFVQVEIALGLLGGASVPLLYFSYAYTALYGLSMVVMVLAIGVLIGLEIPLLTRIMSRYYTLKINISNVLSVDYLGALIATLLFPFLLLPLWGTFKSSLFFGLVNMGIAFMILYKFRQPLATYRRRLMWMAVAATALLALLFAFSPLLLKGWSDSLYQDRIIFSRQTRYQKIVMTKDRRDVRLFINGNLQFSSIDEYRYHEALVHVPLSLAHPVKRVLILGGGDGLALREVLKHRAVAHVDLVDIDPEMVRIATRNPFIRELNRGSLADGRLRIIHQDAFVFLEQSTARWDVILADLPDPNNVALARLYSREFYRLTARHLTAGGVFATQATSVFFAHRAFWCIAKTAAAAGLHTLPYHVQVPSFGDWGFVLASPARRQPEQLRIDVPTRYLDAQTVGHLFVFPRDLQPPQVDVSTLDRPRVLDYYLQGWKYYN